MLNREVCHKCFYTEAQRILGTTSPIYQTFENMWDTGWTICWGSLSKTGRREIAKLPPEDCPYFLEHLLQEQESC
jgi:hypothetical protein